MYEEKEFSEVRRADAPAEPEAAAAPSGGARAEGAGAADGTPFGAGMVDAARRLLGGDRVLWEIGRAHV